MFTFQSSLFKIMTSLCRQNIVYGYQPKRSLFDKTSYIEGWVPRQTQYAKSRKPRLAAWDDPNIIFPVRLPKPTKLQGKALLKEIEKEEQDKIIALRDFHLPDFRVGDVVEVKWIHNISDAKENTYQGIVLQRRMRNSLEGSFKIMFRFCGVECFMYIKQNSPYLRNIKILKRGSGNIRTKTAIWKHTMTQDQVTKPILNKVMKRRYEDGAKKAKSGLSKNLKLVDDKDPLLK